MLINLRNAMMVGRRLPYDAEIEYLKTDGNAYIATGITPPTDSTVSVELTFGFAEGSGRRFLFSDGNQNVTHYCEVNTTPNYGAASAYIPQSLPANTMYRAGATFTSARATYNIDINGTHYTSTTTSYSTSAWRELILFRINVLYKGTGQRIGACKIYVNGVLVRDFIPVRVGTVGYLYDRVSGKLFGNAGTGDFVLGPDVVPVEYIESHGTEYIDTEYQPTSTTDAAVTFTANQNGNSWVMGATTWWGVRYYFNTTPKQVEFANSSTASYRAGVAYTQGDIATLVLQGDEVFADGAKIGEITRSDASSNLTIFGYHGSTNLNISGRVYSVMLRQNGDPIRSFRPIRVGSGSTWEGAMMDVLTRRIYRNAGTGAFNYGNDLKYPIPAS